ncbi:class A beta-lactamase [Hoeflea olei]|uniref:class A beta-lactamase n=1 Tax=Hoeflea olei TaxID=1480615 RepID=UPI001FD91177|nr:class A beta-lactamase [Hoeflea olei]
MSAATAVAFAEPRFAQLEKAVAQVESQLGARVGLAMVDTGTGVTWFHRKDERFLMNSTFKAPLCGAVLARVDAGDISLSDVLRIEKADLMHHAPVTEKNVGKDMTIEALCRAAVDMSDNPAANILLHHIGGPSAMTGYFRSIGDSVSRMDDPEPQLNTFIPGNPRNTTSPAAMAQTLHALLLGDVLSPASRDLLADWMSHGGVTGNLMRAAAPRSWQILDKSGAGSHSRNLIAMVTPEGRAPWIVTIFISDVKAPFETRNAALQSLGRVAISAIGTSGN